jgi:ribosome-associated protein
VKFESLPQGVRLAVEAAQEKKAAAITVLDLSKAGAFTEYFVICTGFSTPQVQAICTEIEEQLYRRLGRSPEHREGYRSAEWALLDFGGFVVHVFSEQARRYYDLERLWRSVPKLDIADASEGPATAQEFGAPAFGRGHPSERRRSESHVSSRGHGPSQS